MDVSGVIYDVKINKKCFCMRIKKHITYFYMQNSLIKKFKKYLKKGRFVTFFASETKSNYHGVMAYKVEYFIKIIRSSNIKQETYYDIDIIRSGIRNLLNKKTNLMFLDLEMSMHDYDINPNFKAEIIQAGFIITDYNGNELERVSNYIKPTMFKTITKRTKKFLGITENDINLGITYKEFYNIFSKTLEKYKPNVLVWGRNDILILKDSYILNEVPNLNEKYNFINLLQIQKNYFNLKNDLGLFNALKIYDGKEYDQKHDALTDAYVTKKVFFLFKNIVNKKEDFAFPTL